METNIVAVQRKKYQTIILVLGLFPALHTFWLLQKIMLDEIHVSETVPMTQLMQKHTLMHTYVSKKFVSDNCLMQGLGVHSKFSGLMDFSGPKKLVYFGGPKFGSNKVQKFFFPHFAIASGL